MSDLRFEGRVVIVTGAGNGLGKSHALALAARGAKVVVNDLGGGRHGEGKSSAAADAVVEEIKKGGGEALASHESVEDGAKIVQAAMDTWGRVDVVINNAGILRDTSFQKITQEDWDLVYRVHVLGAFRVTHAAWNVTGGMRDKNYGRVLFTTSAAGIYGNFGQSNYAMAKLGLVGLSNTLAIEGKKKNILVNAVAPIAGSRLTETVLPPELTSALKPEYVSPLVLWLAHESCEETGGLFEVGGGFFAKLRWQRAEGKLFKLGRAITPESLRSAWKEIATFDKVTYPADITSSMQPILGNLGSQSRGGNELIDVDEALSADLPAVENAYDERDVSLYALGVGAAEDPLDQGELSLVYEMGDMKTFPTFAVVPAMKIIFEQARRGENAPGLNYGFERILHGEQYTEVKRPLPPKARLRHKLKIKDIFDKGKNAVVITSITTTDAETGEELAYNELGAVVRGAGGWGGDRGPAGESNVAPERAPDKVIAEKTHENQALLYRLSGDINPLHVDPAFAQGFGFKKPILHGLCTFGFAARAVIKAFAPSGDPRYFKSIKVRFSDVVFPGETLVTEMWRESDTRILFRTKVAERDKTVISNAAVELYAEIPKPRAQQKAAPAPASSALTSGAIFGAIKAHVEKNAAELTKIGVVYLFKLTGPDSAWTVDLKTGAVTSGDLGKPECTLELAEADFLDMSQGKADPQKLYFGGKLKITGNVMASQKLAEIFKKMKPEDVKAAMDAPPPVVNAAAATAPTQPNAPRIFEALAKRPLPELGGAAVQLTVDGKSWLLTADGAREGADPKASAVLTLGDAALTSWVKGERDARDLHQRGELRVDGDVRVAQKLVFPKGLL